MEKDRSEEVVATLRQIIRAIDLHSKALTKEYGLTGPQLLVLRNIESSNPRTVGMIAKKSNLSSATVTAILDRLEQRNLVARYRSDVDKRRLDLHLTEDARNLLAKDPPLLQSQFTERFDRLRHWEQTLLLSSLQRIADMMEATDIESPPVLAIGPLSESEGDIEEYLGE